MALPDDFSPWQHLREQLLTAHNMNVERTFIGVPIDDLSSPYSGMKIACLLQDDDTVDMFLLRMFLYYFVFQGNLPQPIYGIPIADYDINITYKPQVKLIFKEDWHADLLANNLNRAKAEISYRLMHETSATINHSKAEAIAIKVKQLFAIEGGFTFEKGKVKVTYIDKPNGFQSILTVINKAEAIRVIERVLELSGHAFNEELITVSQSDKPFPSIPPMQQVYGKEKRKPRQRPITRVRFVRAELSVWGLGKPVVLVDRSKPTRGLVL